MASEYNLALKATLDTSQVQQELQRLKHSYTAGSDDGNSFSKGAPGAAHMQKVEVQLTKLNSAISGLQRSIEQLAKQQQRRPAQQAGSVQASKSALPVAPSGNSKISQAELEKIKKLWNGSEAQRSAVARIQASRRVGAQAQLAAMLGEIRGAPGPTYGHAMEAAAAALAREQQNYIASQQRKFININRKNAEAMARMRFGRGMGTLLGGYLLSDAGGLVGGTAGQYMQAVGGGIQAGGGAMMTATMMGLRSAAGPIGIGVGLASVFAGLKSSAEQASAAILKMAEHFEDAYKTAHQTTLKNQLIVQESTHQANADMLERAGMTGEARKLAKYWSERAELIQAQIGD